MEHACTAVRNGETSKCNAELLERNVQYGLQQVQLVLQHRAVPFTESNMGQAGMHDRLSICTPGVP